MGSFVTTPEPEEHKILEYVIHVASLVTLSRRKKKKTIRFVKCYNRIYAEDFSGSSPKSFRKNKNRIYCIQVTQNSNNIHTKSIRRNETRSGKYITFDSKCFPTRK